MNRNKLYDFLSTACIVGFVWIVFSYSQNVTNDGDLGVCLFKRVTHLPCPSCGSTRSVLSILKGDFSGALIWNPIGYLLMFFLMVTPIWIFLDTIRNKSTLFICYRKGERILQNKWVACLAILAVVLNWIWNIYKDL